MFIFFICIWFIKPQPNSVYKGRGKTQKHTRNSGETHAGNTKRTNTQGTKGPTHTNHTSHEGTEGRGTRKEKDPTRQRGAGPAPKREAHGGTRTTREQAGEKFKEGVMRYQPYFRNVM